LDVSRRAILKAGGLLPLATLAPSLIEHARADAKAGTPFRFLTPHEARVVEEATARLVPGPLDDPLEALVSSPGAREANIVRYVDNLLSAFDHNPPRIFASGPWSNRHLRPGDEHEDYMAEYVPLVERQVVAWQRRVNELQKAYRAGVKELDAHAGGDFSAASPSTQDGVLVTCADFRAVLMNHTLEGMYSVPEYGGNAKEAGWLSIGWRGDSQPTGYTPHQVETSDGPDVIDPTGIVELVLGQLPIAAKRMSSKGWRFGG
jgi:hypothetical protein